MSIFNVHVRVNDADTGKPIPVRLRIVDAAGRHYPPLGRVEDFAIGRNEDVGGHLLLGRERWYYIDGSCEVPLPSGVPLTIEATRGLEYEPLKQEFTLGSGQMALRFTIKRWINLRAERWHSGDTRCHFISPHAALLEAMAEDLAFVNLLATETLVASQDAINRIAIPNLHAFSGQQPALEKAGHIVAVNTHNVHPILGHLALLNCHRPVFPLSFGGADSTDDWSLADWCEQCHRKKGLAIWTDPFRPDALVTPEALADLIMGRIDAVECTPTSTRVGEWYRAWNAGIRFPLVGASGKESNRTALGGMRTYTHIDSDGAPNYASWIEAIRAGRTFVTNGPLVRFEVNEGKLGSVMDFTNATTVSLRVRLDSRMETTTPLEIVRNGEVVFSLGCHARIDDVRELEIADPCWLAARIAGQPMGGSIAHTSPIFVRVAGRMPANAVSARQYHDAFGRTLDWIESTGRFDKPRRKEQLVALIEQARQKLLSMADARVP